MAAPGNGIPHQDVAVQTMRVFASLVARIGSPIVVIRSAHLMLIAILEWPTDPNISGISILPCSQRWGQFDLLFGA